MADNVLESYLVKLGFRPDGASLSRFKGSLKEAESSVGAMAKVTLGAAAITGGFFAGLALGAVKLIDKVAMADQSYRLFALRMFTTQKVGRELSMTLKALGVTLEDITWDKELHGRAMQMFRDQETILANMGPGFEKNMVLVRDMKFEFQRLGVVAQYSLQDVIGKLIQGFAPEWMKMHGGMKGTVDYLIQNLPAIDTMITGKLVWGLKEVERVSKEIWGYFKQIDVLLVDMVGILTGHPELVGKPFSGANNVAAGKDLAGSLKNGLQNIDNYLGKNTSQTGGSHSPAIGNLMTGAGISFAKGVLAPDMATSDADKIQGWKNVWGAVKIEAGNKGWLMQPEGENIIRRMVKIESGGHQFGPGGQVLTSSAGAMGLMQLMPRTAAGLHVNPSDPAQNLFGGAEYMAQLVKKYHGNTYQAAEAYNWGPGKLDAALRSHTPIPQSVQDYATAATGIHIGQVVIHVPAGTDATRMPAVITKAMQDTIDKHTKKNRMQSVAGPYAHGTGN